MATIQTAAGWQKQWFVVGDGLTPSASGMMEASEAKGLRYPPASAAK